jgi:hypothetical protein
MTTSLITTLILSVAASCFAQVGSDPADLISLRDSWSRARSAAVSPIDKKFEDALLAMKDRYTKAGNLKAAVAVDAELNRLKGGTAAPSAPAAQQPAATGVIIPATTKLAVKTKRDLEKFMEGTTWMLTKGGKAWGVAEFHPRGKLFYQKDRTWSVREDRKFMMEGYTCTLSDDLTRFEVVWGETGPLVGILTKKEEPK